MSNVLISVVSQFDKKGFTQADRGVSALTKSVAKFTSGLALAHKTQQAMLAYMADEKATKILAQNLKNLGFAYGSAGAEEFIASMQKQTGILDDELRPAYAQLARVTGSTAETQRLMSLAFDVSSGTGKDYASVIDALSQAYVGNTKGLKSLNIGLTQAELKTKSFKEITDLLNQEFKGAGAAALDSYAGKMAILQVTTADAAETIGKSLLDALSTASGEGGFESFIKNIDSATAGLSRLITHAGRGVAAIKIFGNPTKTMQEKLAEFKKLQTQVWAEDLSAAQRKAGMKVWYPEQKAAVTALTKLEKDRLALLKKQTAEKKAQAAIDKAQKALLGAKSIFDLERIQLEAASKTATGEDLLRIKLKQEIIALEDAIQAKNVDLATKLANLVTTDQQRLTALMAQNAQLEKMKGLYDQIISKDVVINFTSNGLGAILNAAGGLTGRGNVVIPNEIGSSTSSSSASSSSSSASSAAAAASAASSAAAAAATLSSAAADAAATLSSAAADAAAASSSAAADAAAASSSAAAAATLSSAAAEAAAASSSTAAAAAAASSSTVAAAVAETVTTITNVLGDLVTQTDVLTKDTKDAVDAIATLTEDSTALADATTVPPSSIGSGFIDWLMTQSAQGKQDTPPVTVTITENAANLIDLVVSELQQQDASGISTRIQRNTGGFD